MMKCALLMTVMIIAACQAERRATSSAPLTSAPDLSNCPDDRVAGVGGADEAPVVLARVEPDFRDSAGAKGIVIIETVIARTGDVCAARVLRGVSPSVDTAALAAVRQWRFTPAKKAGQPVQAVFDISVPVGS